MRADTAEATSKAFGLTSPPKPGEVPNSVTEELRLLRTRMNSAAAEFREAIKVQSGKYKVKPTALRRYVNALASDKVDEVRAETDDLERLIGSPGAAE
jgi:hypothetical protein